MQSILRLSVFGRDLKKQLAHIEDENLTEHLESMVINKQESEYSIEMSDKTVLIAVAD